MATLQATPEQLAQAILGLARSFAGLAPDAGGLAQRLQLRVGVTLLSQIQQAFTEKARGGTGSDGIKWKPLKPSTIAQRPITRGERKAAGLKASNRVRGLLTPAEDRRWRRIFAVNKARLMLRGMGEGAASALAAKFAWAALKASGAKTRIGLFGNRQVEIGRDTGVLFRSLTPGVEDRPARQPEQICEATGGAVIVGSKVPYADHFHRHRPLWPDTLPAAWLQAILESLQRGIALALADYLGRVLKA